MNSLFFNTFYYFLIMSIGYSSDVQLETKNFEAISHIGSLFSPQYFTNSRIFEWTQKKRRLRLSPIEWNIGLMSQFSNWTLLKPSEARTFSICLKELPGLTTTYQPGKISTTEWYPRNITAPRLPQSIVPNIILKLRNSEIKTEFFEIPVKRFKQLEDSDSWFCRILSPCDLWRVLWDNDTTRTINTIPGRYFKNPEVIEILIIITQRRPYVRTMEIRYFIGKHVQQFNFPDDNNKTTTSIRYGSSSNSGQQLLTQPVHRLFPLNNEMPSSEVKKKMNIQQDSSKISKISLIKQNIQESLLLNNVDNKNTNNATIIKNSSTHFNSWKEWMSNEYTKNQKIKPTDKKPYFKLDKFFLTSLPFIFSIDVCPQESNWGVKSWDEFDQEVPVFMNFIAEHEYTTLPICTLHTNLFSKYILILSKSHNPLQSLYYQFFNLTLNTKPLLEDIFPPTFTPVVSVIPTQPILATPPVTTNFPLRTLHKLTNNSTQLITAIVSTNLVETTRVTSTIRSPVTDNMTKKTTLGYTLRKEFTTQQFVISTTPNSIPTKTEKHPKRKMWVFLVSASALSAGLVGAVFYAWRIYVADTSNSMDHSMSIYEEPSYIQLLNALCLRSSFTPDEHWQSAEVAHWLTYGYGFLTWEWEPCIALRSVLHPLIIACFYKLLSVFHVDTPFLVAQGPRIFIGAFTAAATDIGTYKVTELFWNKTVAKIALACSILSWFNFFTLCRTYSSCLEAAFNIWGIYFWLKSRIKDDNKNQNYDFYISLIISSIVTALRPTAVIFWIFLFGIGYATDAIYSISFKVCEQLLNLLLVIICFMSAPCINILIDKWFYGHWTIPMFNFAQFNLLADPGQFYGARPWHFYTLECPLIVLFSYFPCTLWGASCMFYQFSNRKSFVSTCTTPAVVSNTQSELSSALLHSEKDTLGYSSLVSQRRKVKTNKTIQQSSFGSVEICNGEKNGILKEPLLILIVFIINVYLLSQASHKEYRLLLPFLPMLLPFTAYGITKMFSIKTQVCSLANGRNSTIAFQQYENQFTDFNIRAMLRKNKWTLSLIFLPQIILAFASNIGYLVGAEKTMNILRDKITRIRHDKIHPSSINIFFLTSCHDLPFYSFIHDNSIKMGFLDCSPQLRSVIQNTKNISHTQSFSTSWRARFLLNPQFVLNQLFPISSNSTNTANKTQDKTWDVYLTPYPNTLYTRRATWFGGYAPIILDTYNKNTYNYFQALLHAAMTQPSSLETFAKCLDYRFQLPLQSQELPTIFVVPSVILPEVNSWLKLNKYKKTHTIFNSIIAEHPIPGYSPEWMSSIHLFSRI